MAGQDVLLIGTVGVSIDSGFADGQAYGARVFGTSSSEEKARRAKELAADLTVNYREQQNWGAVIRDTTGSRGVDLTTNPRHHVGSRKQQIEMVPGLRSLGMKPHVDQVFPVTRLQEAFADQIAGKHFGKIAIGYQQRRGQFRNLRLLVS